MVLSAGWDELTTLGRGSVDPGVREEGGGVMRCERYARGLPRVVRRTLANLPTCRLVGKSESWRVGGVRAGGGVSFWFTGGVRERGELQEVGRARSGGVMNRDDKAGCGWCGRCPTGGWWRVPTCQLFDFPAFRLVGKLESWRAQGG